MRDDIDRSDPLEMLKAAGYRLRSWGGPAFGGEWTVHFEDGEEVRTLAYGDVPGWLEEQGRAPTAIQWRLYALEERVKFQGFDLERQQHASSITEHMLTMLLSYKLQACYAEHGLIWFTSSIKDQWGDDWNDRPWHCNAGSPYDWTGSKRVAPYMRVALGYDGDFWHENDHDVSQQDIIAESMSLLLCGEWRIRAGMSLHQAMTVAEKARSPLVYTWKGKGE